MNPPHHPIIGTAMCPTTAQAVAQFLDAGCPDDAARTMAVATLTLSLWQITHGPITATVPSVLLVHATEEAAGDPIDAFASVFVFREVRELLQRLKQQEETGIQRTLACPGEPGPSMRTAFISAEEARKRGITSYFEGACALFNNYRSTYHGGGPAYPYGRAWSDDYGWLSGAGNRMVLRLDQPGDRKTFRKDLLGGSPKLREPRGLDQHLQMESKELALSGSLPGSEWDRQLVDALLEDGWPVLFLPHATTAPLEIPYSADLHLVCMQVAATGWHKPAAAWRVLPNDPRIQHFHRALMKRLVHMPLDYAFNVQRVLRELLHVCFRLARVICAQGGGPDALTMIAQDLFRSTLRAVVIGVASLAYHGWGFDTGVPRASVQQLLEHLRTNGPQTRRDLQRKFPLWLKAEKRDALLDRLAEEGLVICPGALVSAAPLSEFIPWLHRRPEFPVEGCLSSLLLAKKSRKEGPLPGPQPKPKRRRKPRVARNVKAAGEAAVPEPNAAEETPDAA